MKFRLKIFLPMLVLISFESFCQKIDTTFLLKDIRKNHYHTVYIDKNKESNKYRRIGSFNIDELPKQEYAKSLNELQKKWKEPFVNYNIDDLPKRWCTLHKFRGKYYVYSPSNFLNNHQISLSDSVFIENYGSDIVFSMLKSFQKLNNCTFLFFTKVYNMNTEKIIVHIIDKKHGIAIFERKNDGIELTNYELMVDARKIKNFPVIVNDSRTQMELEITFDKVNYKKLIQSNQTQ